MDEFDTGDAVTLSVTWFNLAGAAVAATTVLRVRSPSGVLTAYTGGQLSNPATGRYQVTLPAATEAGQWFYRWEASGALIAAEESSYYVRPSRVL